MSDTLFSGKYRNKSVRASWHNYDGGMYFVTICTIAHSLGRIENGKMQLSEIGKIAEQNLQNINADYPYAEIPLFVVMPNHVHAIVVIDGGNGGQCVDGQRRDAINRVSTRINETPKTGGITGKHNPMLHKNLARIIRWVKGRITHYAHTHNIPFQWQARYHDRIIRNQDECNRIADYIENNVANWDMDAYNV